MTTTEDDPIAAFLATSGDELLERLNDDVEDSLLLVARVVGGRPGARRATVGGGDRLGIDLLVVDDDGEHAERVEFADPVSDPLALTGAPFELVRRARAVSGQVGQTTAERNMAELAAIRTSLTTVSSVVDVHPHLRRITFAGGDLATFAPIGPDTFCSVLLPPPGSDTLTIDQTFTWEQHAQMGPRERPLGAYYTVRAWRPDVAELDMLFVLHGDGHGSSWAARARRGDPVALWGPRSGFHPPADVTWLLLAADETGRPAVAAILDQLPPGTAARVFAEVADRDERQELPERPDTVVTWLHRDGRPAGTTTLLADAVAAATWPAGIPYVWGGGERHAMTAVRRHVRDVRGLDRAHVSLMAYWRRTGG